MDSYSKSEIDAKLALSAEKAGRSTDGIASQLALVLSGLERLTKDVHDFKLEAKADAVLMRSEVKDDYKNVKNTLIGVAVGAVGIVIAIVALAYTQAGNMTTANGNVLSAFSAGQASAEAKK